MNEINKFGISTPLFKAANFILFTITFLQDWLEFGKDHNFKIDWDKNSFVAPGQDYIWINGWFNKLGLSLWIDKVVK